MKFTDVAEGAFFEHEQTVWQRVAAEGLWNARCGEYWAQFEPDEDVRPSDYRPPTAWAGHQ